MKYKCKFNCDFIEQFDMFGKKVELYYNGKNKKTSFIRFIFTIIYIAIYLFLFIR